MKFFTYSKKKRKQLYTKHPYTQQLNATISMLLYLVLVAHLEPDILACKVKWPLGSITKNKTSWNDGIPAELFKIQKMMLFECYPQYISKFGKLSSGHRTGKGQFSFQSWRRAMPKNAQTTVQLQSFQMIARVCSKSFKLGFSSTWTENFQMCKLGFKEPEEPDIKMPTFAAPWRKQGSSRKPSTSVLLTMLKPLRVWITTHRGESLKDGSTRPPDLLPEKPVCRSGSNS